MAVGCHWLPQPDMSYLAVGDAVLAWPPKLEYDWPAQVADPAMLAMLSPEERLAIVPSNPAAGTVLVMYLGGKSTFSRWSLVECSTLRLLRCAEELDDLYVPQTGSNKKVGTLSCKASSEAGLETLLSGVRMCRVWATSPATIVAD